MNCDKDRKYKGDPSEWDVQVELVDNGDGTVTAIPVTKETEASE